MKRRRRFRAFVAPLLVVLSPMLIPLGIAGLIAAEGFVRYRARRIAGRATCAACGTPLGSKSLLVGRRTEHEFREQYSRDNSGVKVTWPPFTTPAICSHCGAQHHLRRYDNRWVFLPIDRHHDDQPRRSAAQAMAESGPSVV